MEVWGLLLCFFIFAFVVWGGVGRALSWEDFLYICTLLRGADTVRQNCRNSAWQTWDCLSYHLDSWHLVDRYLLWVVMAVKRN